ncbi:MAG: UDP-N-acetylglucosamine 1-carboxyvinyltransferase [Limnochordia bacterium]
MTGLEKLYINGGVPLRGEVQISGAKNAVLKIMAAALLGQGPSLLSNVPQIRDVKTMCSVLRSLGAQVESGHGTVKIDPGTGLMNTAPHDLVKGMRASIQVLGPLLGRLGEVKVALPGGCAIGDRPIDMHLEGLKAMGAEIRDEHGYVLARATKLRGARIHLDYPSVGATENLMMAASLAEGETVLLNPAKEPEIIESQRFLNKMGAQIRGAGTNRIVIKGVRQLKGADYRVGPDRIEAGTFMVAAALTGGEILINGAVEEHLGAVIHKLQQAGVQLQFMEGNRVLVRSKEKLQPIQLRTMPYPGFPTDMQPQFMVLSTVAAGVSIITEAVYNNRFKHVNDLRRMGADIYVEGRTAVIKGTQFLSGACVTCPDLRAGAALVLAGLAANGQTVVEDIAHIDRGYENLESKLAQLGADIVRQQSGEQAC